MIGFPISIERWTIGWPSHEDAAPVCHPPFHCDKKQNTCYSRTMEMRFEITSMNPLSNTYLSSSSMELLDDGKGAYHDNRQLFILRTPISRHDHIDCQTLACNMLVNALSKKKCYLSIHRSHHTNHIRLREKKHHSQSSLSREMRTTRFRASIASLGTWGGKAGIRRVCCAHAGPNVVARWCPV